MDTKAAFEKWWVDSGAHLLHSENGPTKAKYFDIWTASRAAIEIDIKNLENHPDDYFMDGYNDAISDITDELTSHGIRIKGNAE